MNKKRPQYAYDLKSRGPRFSTGSTRLSPQPARAYRALTVGLGMGFVAAFTSLVSAQTQPAGMPNLPEAARVQTTLALVNFSSGAIDGMWGDNTHGALRAFQKAHGLEVSGELDPKTRELLQLDRDDLLVQYQLTSSDLAGPFIDEVPEDPADQAQLEHLAYTSPAEAIAEKFHLTEEMLKSLNPEIPLEAGSTLWVPNLETDSEKDIDGQAADRRVVVTKSKSSLELRDARDNLMFYAPVTAGSTQEPLPLGEWKVQAISINPNYYYDPELILGADPGDAEASLPAGPNNPVGTVWIGIDKEHYGIHGTPEPSKIGYSMSSGCVRLTNWDAHKLAKLVSAGTRVTFQE